MHVPTFKALRKEKEEESEEQMRKSTLAEEFEESPEGKRCKIVSQPDVSPTVTSSSAVLITSFPKSLPNNNFSIFKVQSGSGHSIPIPGGRRKREKRSKKQNTLQKLVAKLQCKTT